MKTFFASVFLFVLVFSSFIYVVSQYGMYNIYDEQGNVSSVMPFTTEAVARSHAIKYCGAECFVKRVYK